VVLDSYFAWLGTSEKMDMSGDVVVNTRSLSAGLTGVQRYTAELCARFVGRVTNIQPARPLQGVKGHLWEQFRLPALVRGRLLWSPANSGPIVVGRQVVTVHDVAVIDHPEWYNPRFAAWYRWMTPRLVHRASHIMAVSEFTKRRLIDVLGVDEARVIVVPNGVDDRFCPRSPEEVAMARARLGIPSPNYFLSLATSEPRKNLAGQLAAWSRCIPHLPSNVWLVVSGAKGKEHVFRAAKMSSVPPRVHFTGYVQDEDLPALYSGAIGFLYPSFYEGFGLPVLEAMACGSVPIVSRATAPQELAGDAGIAVDPHDHDSIASAIVKVIKEVGWREQLSRCATRRSSTFSWDRSAEMTWQVLQGAARQNINRSAVVSVQT
jgi:glycosyltransferase involved in cell wall biosynthesis